MDTLIGFLIITFMIVGAIGWLWIVVTAFSDGEAIWGVGCLILWPVSLIYGIMNFGDLRIPFFMLLVGMLGRIGLAVVAIAMS